LPANTLAYLDPSSFSKKKSFVTLTPDFRYTCKFCLKTFSRKDHLTIHEDLHTFSSETFPCDQCGATFKNRKTLTGHLKTHSSQVSIRYNFFFFVTDGWTK
jgi:uncharacterized Zn-finger protein